MIQAYLNDSISETGTWQVEIYETVDNEPTDESEFETFTSLAEAEGRVEQINKAQPSAWGELPERRRQK